MNREDIVRMAQEAGAIHYWHLSNLERFAALVASAERERIKQANAPEIERINAYIKEALAQPEQDGECKFCTDGCPACDARKLPEQEPVAWVDLLKEAQQIVESKVLWKRFIDGTPLSNDIACWMAAFAQQHTNPPQRTWVGLTYQERCELWNISSKFSPDSVIMHDFAKDIELALREKNYDRND